MELSKRLRAVASLVTEGASVADIGTDHGYIPIYLAEKGVSIRIIAVDINKGPLERARLHIMGHKHVCDRIETRLSDGLKKIAAGEIDTVIAAGMGGGLIVKILSESAAVVDTLSSLILQPQSEVDKVRRYLTNINFRIVEENMVCEDCKYYPMMKAIRAEAEIYTELEYIYGKQLLDNKHPILKEYLHKEERIKKEIAQQLKAAGTATAEKRMIEIEQELAQIKQALLFMEGSQCN